LAAIDLLTERPDDEMSFFFVVAVLKLQDVKILKQTERASRLRMKRARRIPLSGTVDQTVNQNFLFLFINYLVHLFIFRLFRCRASQEFCGNDGGSSPSGFVCICS
jgi:hypothetical protein